MHLRHISPGSMDWLDAVLEGGDEGVRRGGKSHGHENRVRFSFTSDEHEGTDEAQEVAQEF
jgi:hypothetical protein